MVLLNFVMLLQILELKVIYFFIVLRIYIATFKTKKKKQQQ